MNKRPTKLRETSGYDELKTQAIDRFRSQDPMTLSNSELRSAIDYMLAYRWALNGDEDVLHEYIEASKIRNEDRHPSQNDLPPIDKFHPDWWYYRQEMEEPVEIDNNYKNESRYMNKKLIRLTESDLHKIVKEAVNRILSEGKPKDMMIGRHKFTGVRYDGNGNPIYTHPSKLEDPDGGTLSDDDLKGMGWKYSKKRGLHGQIQDPTRLPK